MRKINRIVVHCSDSDYPQHDNIEVIDQWHRQRGWKMVGYHYFIKFYDGSIQLGRPLDMIGSHAQGYNSESIGICLSGSKHFSQMQFETLAKLCKNLMDKFDLMVSDIYGHCELDNHKTCPNFSVEEFRKCLESNLIPMKADMISKRDS